MGIAIRTATLTGLHVGRMEYGALTYYPAHSKNGKNVDAQCKITAICNTRTGRKHTFQLNSWGGFADLCAKTLGEGKAFNASGKLESYQGKIFTPEGKVIVDNAGNPYTVTRTSLKIDDLDLGRDSDKLIARQIVSGKRPADWNVEGSQGKTIWDAQIKGLMAMKYDPVQHAKQFGYATVRLVEGSAAPIANQNLQSQVAGAVENMQQAVANVQGAAEMAAETDIPF